MADERSERFEIRLTPKEATMLRELADHRGVSMADVLRMYVREAHAALPKGAVNA